MSRLIHYGKAHLQSVRSVPDQSIRHGGSGKPGGLWVSVEGEHDWKEWCESENWGCLDFATEVVLHPAANVLRLRGSAMLDAFHAEYSFVDYVYPRGLGERTAIDWAKVAAKHQGIIIAPYVWSRRLDGAVSDWYYGWDCASGCIWDANAVAELRPVEQAQAA